MPTYEYACKDCGQHLEVVQSFKDDALTVCPACDGSLRKVFSATGIIFKGSGWHIKDYKTGAAASSSSGSSTESSSDGPSSGSSGDKADSGAAKTDTSKSDSSTSSSSTEAKSA